MCSAVILGVFLIMAKKIKLELDFYFGDLVVVVSNPSDPVVGVITEIKFSPSEVQYLVASGLDEKFCYTSELEAYGKSEETK